VRSKSLTDFPTEDEVLGFLLKKLGEPWNVGFFDIVVESKADVLQSIVGVFAGHSKL